MIEIPQLGKAFSQVLREARLKAGLSQDELARHIHCARTFVSALENATYQPSFNAFMAISFALGVTPSELMRQVENRLAFLTYLDGQAGEEKEAEAGEAETD